MAKLIGLHVYISIGMLQIRVPIHDGKTPPGSNRERRENGWKKLGSFLPATNDPFKGKKEQPKEPIPHQKC